MSSETPAPEEPAPTMLEELQSWWEIVSIAQYISLFRESFNLPEIEIEELENGLIEDSTKGSSPWLQNLILSLLRTLMSGRVNQDNWEVCLQKLITRGCPADKETPFPAGKTFSELGLRAKVDIIYLLCVFRLDKNDIAEVMKSMDADALRVQKLGLDDSGNSYWYFYGTRLYKEESAKEKSWDDEWNCQKTKTFKKRRRGRPRKVRKMKSDGESDDFEDVNNDKYMNVDAKSRWSVVCDTLEQWIAFAAKFKDSKSKNEKSLFQIIQENFLPTLSNIYEEKEKKIQQKLKELMPIREKIVTRRETRKLRGEVYIDESTLTRRETRQFREELYNDETHKLHLIRDRARRLEERNKKIDLEAQNRREKKQRHSDGYEGGSSGPDISQDADEYNNASTPPIVGWKMDLQSQMERLMSSVKLHKDAWPFVYPVNDSDAPGYYDFIQDPIDLSTIESRLRDGRYETVGDLDSDFSQMVTNCELYNGENHAFSKMAQTLWAMFRKGVSKILDSLPSEDHSNDVSEENSNSSDHILKSPHIQKSKKHKEEKRKKKRKPARGLEALEMLAQASELAIQLNNMIRTCSPKKTASNSQPSQAAPNTVPSKKRPCYAPVTTVSTSVVKTTLPITSSNFIPVHPQGVSRNKPFIIRTKMQPPVPAQTITTSFNRIPNTNESYTSVAQNNNNLYQTTVSRTLPVVFSGYNTNNNQPSSSNQNQVPVTVQSNMSLPNSRVVQRVIIPSGQQHIQLENGQRIIFATPQGAVNRLFGSNLPPPQLQSSTQQLNQGQAFEKVVPQLVAQAPIMQVSKDELLQRLQIQAVAQNGSQTFTQVAQNPQFVNIPTYMITNQNQVQPTMMTMQQFQMAQGGQMQMNGQGNG